MAKKAGRKSGTIVNDAVFFTLFEAKRSRGDLRKLQIIEAAIELIATQGVRSVGYESIGKHLGIARAHVAYHFETIDGIFEQVAKYITATAQAITVVRIKEARDWREQIEAYVEGAFLWCERHPKQVSAYILLNYFCTFDARHRELHTLIRNTGSQRISSLIEPHLRSGKDRTRRAASLGRAIQCLIRGYVFDAFVADQVISLGEACSEAKKAALALIDSGR
jgi:AcrR family transcriptional regulator